MNRPHLKAWILTSSFVGALLCSQPISAQVIPDATLPAGERSQVSGNPTVQIDGGAQRGAICSTASASFRFPRVVLPISTMRLMCEIFSVGSRVGQFPILMVCFEPTGQRICSCSIQMVFCWVRMRPSTLAVRLWRRRQRRSAFPMGRSSAAMQPNRYPVSCLR